MSRNDFCRVSIKFRTDYSTSPLHLRLSCYYAFNDLVDVVQAGGEEDPGPDPLPLYLRLSFYCVFNDLVDVVQAGGEEDLGPDPLPLYLRQSH